MEDNYTAYFNAFLNAALKRLKSGFGTVLTFYPYEGGAVIKVEMKKGVAHHMEKRGLSTDVGDALAKTTLFDKTACKALSDRGVTGTLVYIGSVNDYVLIKGNAATEWSELKAVDDFENIVVKVKSLYGN